MNKSILAGAGLLAVSLAANGEVAYTKSLDIEKVAPGEYVATCYAQYSGFDATHDYLVSLSIMYGGNNTSPTNAVTGPNNRRVRISEPGLWDFVITFRKGIITATRTYYLFGEPTTNGDIYSSISCDGALRDEATLVTLVPHFRLSHRWLQ